MISPINNDLVVCRPALQKDTDEVMELCAHIWEGGDYIPQVWEDWMKDPQGMLGVAEMNGHIAGIFKLTRFQEQEWYMEGLRVHPDVRDRGVAAHIHNYVLETWRRVGGGRIRLTTGSYNVKIHHLCEQSGFRRVAEFIPYRAPVMQEAVPHFSVLSMDEAEKALQFVLDSPSHALSSGLINLGWVYADPQLKHLQEAIQEKHAWWWKGGTGFISIWEDREDEQRSPGIQLLGCSLEEMDELLMDYRRLMGSLGYATAGWVAPNQPPAISSLEKVGFERSWDVSLYIFELQAR